MRTIQRVVFWRGRRWSESRPVGAVLEREYLTGESLSEHDFRAVEEVRGVRVWRAVEFGDGGPQRGFIRGRQAVGEIEFSTHDAEGAANWMFHADSSDDDILVRTRRPPAPWQPPAGLALDGRQNVRWEILRRLAASASMPFRGLLTGAGRISRPLPTSP